MVEVLVIYLLAPIVIAFLFQKYKIFHRIGTIIMAYIIGIAISLSGMVSENESLPIVQGYIMNIAVPLAIPLMLFSSDFKLWIHSLPKTVIALFAGLFSIIVAIISGFFIFKHTDLYLNSNLDLPGVSSLLVGMYTGGTMNFFALDQYLQIDVMTLLTVYTLEMMLTFPWVLFIVGGGFRLFRKWLPFADGGSSVAGQEEPNNNIEDYSQMLDKKNLKGMLCALALAIGIYMIGVALSFAITGEGNPLVVILTVTTLSIIASFSDKIRKLPKTFEMGMLFILMFSVVVASQFRFTAINESNTLLISLFIIYIILVVMILHILICRIFKVSGDLFTVCNIGLLCSPPFVPPVVEALGNKKVLISGIAVGLVGYAIGTYLGILLSVILSYF